MTQPANNTRRAIEESFPIVEINRLAVPERNAFKPIYQMHKWFARRASCVFRAILLGCLKPAYKPDGTRTDIMAEFYKDHTNDPDTKGKVILDPFMGGGTTVVEALRLGCKVIGIDLNPVAWFIVKTEVEPVNIAALKDAFERLANRRVEWSGKSVRETLLEQYKTQCPCCGGEADIIYTFWVKSAICHNEKCPARSDGYGIEVPLFSDYMIAQRKPSIRYWRDVRCPKCKKTFDWETEPATLIAEPKLMVNAGASAGELRGNPRWAYSVDSKVKCPWCTENVNPLPYKQPKRERKKVRLTVLLCPHCESIWQWRGELPDEVKCPACEKTYPPISGNVTEKGKFICYACGTITAAIESVRRLPEIEPLPMKPYAIEGFCPHCGAGGEGEPEEESGLFEKRTASSALEDEMPGHQCCLTKNGSKFYKRITPADLARFQKASQTWDREKTALPYPKQGIPDGQETHRLLEHHYRHWHQMFTSRQLLCLATLLKGIEGEERRLLKEMLLLAFSNTLETNNCFTRNRPTRNSAGGTAAAGIFSRHDYQPKSTFSEQNVWGVVSGSNTFTRRMTMLYEGLHFSKEPWDTRFDAATNEFKRIPTAEQIPASQNGSLMCGDSREILIAPDIACDLVVTDPPYSGNVNYAELADFFYVWLRLALAQEYPQFAPDETPKTREIIKNPTRSLSDEDFRLGLQEVFSQAKTKVSDEGLLAFTFHHSQGTAWESLLLALCQSSWQVESIYPVHAESEVSLHLMDKEGAISYDLIHVCKKRDPSLAREPRSWAGIRHEIRRRARDEIRAIEQGGYGNEPLSPADVNIILIGKCLKLYSRHYSAVIDHEGRTVELHDALKEIRSMVDDLVSKEHPLPSELEDVDAESRTYLLALCSHKEIKSDEVHKVTRGVLEPEDLIEAGLMVKGRAKRGRTYEVKQPTERYGDLAEKFRADVPALAQLGLFRDDAQPVVSRKVKFIDHVHFLMGLVEAGENLLPWLERFRGLTPQLRAACSYLKDRNSNFASTTQKILNLLDPAPLFRTPVKSAHDRS
jgi:adenine-specific DNA methylase